MKNINCQDIKIRNNITNFFYKKIPYINIIFGKNIIGFFICRLNIVFSCTRFIKRFARIGCIEENRSDTVGYFYVDHLSSTRLKINVTRGVAYGSNYVRFGPDQDKQGSVQVTEKQ